MYNGRERKTAATNTMRMRVLGLYLRTDSVKKELTFYFNNYTLLPRHFSSRDPYMPQVRDVS